MTLTVHRKLSPAGPAPSVLAPTCPEELHQSEPENERTLLGHIFKQFTYGEMSLNGGLNLLLVSRLDDGLPADVAIMTWEQIVNFYPIAKTRAQKKSHV